MFNSCKEELFIHNFKRMYYIEITKIEFDSHQQSTALTIKGSLKLHCITFHPDGTIQSSKDICDCNECFVGNMMSCEYGKDDNDIDNDIDNDSDNEVYSEGEDENDERIDIADVVKIGDVIALRTPRDVHESFYLCVVKEVTTAFEDVFDS